MKRIRIGNNIAITWLLYENNGEIHNLEGKELELYMTCGGYKFPVVDYTVTENAVAWTFPAALQTRTGYYRFVLIERDEAMGLKSFDVREAFCLEPKNALTNIRTISNTDCAITVKSVLTYAHITNLASVDTVEAEDGSGTLATISLTNGKSFTLPLGKGSGGSGDVNGVVFAKQFPDWENEPGVSGGGRWYFDRDTLSALPNDGDSILFFEEGGTYCYLWGWRVSVEENENSSSGYNIYAFYNDLIYDEITLGAYPAPVDNLLSTDKNLALSANMGRELKRLIDAIPTSGGGSSQYVLPVASGTQLGGVKVGTGLSIDGNTGVLSVTGGGGGGSSEDQVKTMYSAYSEPGTPVTDAGKWHSARGGSDIWMAVQYLIGGSWGSWNVIYIGDDEAPYASFKSFAFTRSNSTVSAPSGGSYTDPNPTTEGWSDGIPAGNGKVWVSTRIFASDGTHSDPSWATPRILADTETMDYEYSSVANNPGTPNKATPTSAGTNPNWSDNADETTIWMAMREISNGVYKTGSTWKVVKIKGENGTNGSSVQIKGTVSSVGDLPGSGNTAGDGYILSTNGHLYVWDGESWEDVGQVKGDPGQDGQTPYLHIGYSNDGGINLTTNNEPGDYIGTYVDYNSEPSTNPNDYAPWKYWKGQDGFGYEYIFYLENTGEAPLLPVTSENVDDYVPAGGWTDDFVDIGPSNRYSWQAWRKKEDGVWSAWHGKSNGTARLYAHYGEDGAPGRAQFKSIVFKRSATTPTRPGNGTTAGQSDYGGTFEDPVPYGWSDGIPPLNELANSDDLSNTLWVTSRVFTSDTVGQDENWKDPVQGVDTDDWDIEYAYEQTSDAQPVSPIDGPDGNRHGCSPASNQVWFDPVDDKYDGGILRDWTLMYWMALRPKKNGEGMGVWTILRIKGEKGTDGVDGKDANPVRLRNWSEIAGQTLTGSNRVFSGYEDGAPFRDVIVVTKSDYPNGYEYPWSTIYDGKTQYQPVLVAVNYSPSYDVPNTIGIPGTFFTNERLPQSGNYSNTLPASKTASASAFAQNVYYAVFENLGAVYIQLLVATQAYIGELTVDDLLAYNANIAGFIFQNQRLESSSLDDNDEPNLVLDGTNGEIIAKKGTIGGYEITADGYLHAAAENGGSVNLDKEQISGSRLVGSYYEQYYLGNWTGANNGILWISTDSHPSKYAIQTLGPNAASFGGNVKIEGDTIIEGSLIPGKLPLQLVTAPNNGASNLILSSAYSGIPYMIAEGAGVSTIFLPSFSNDANYHGFYLDVMQTENANITFTATNNIVYFGNVRTSGTSVQVGGYAFSRFVFVYKNGTGYWYGYRLVID